MKIHNNLLKIILITNIAFLGLGSSQVKAAEETGVQSSQQNQQQRNPNFDNQAEQLRLAVNDRVNVVNSNAYYNYTSQEIKAEYESAIENGKSILARLDSASYNELRNATIRINNAKERVENQANNQVQKSMLEQAIERSKITIEAANLVMRNAKNIASKNSQYLMQLINEAENLIAKAERILASL